jgi:hypothetical protein
MRIANIIGLDSLAIGSSFIYTDSTANGIWSLSSTTYASINAQGLLNALSAGLDTIKYTVQNGCGTFVATKPIQIIANPCLPSYVPTNGLVGWWPFCGNANDESGNGNNGTTKNGVALTVDRNGNANSAYSFDGVDDYISVPYNSSLDVTSVSICGWINVSTLSANVQGLVSRWNQTGTPCNAYCTSIDLTSKFTGACTQYVNTVLFANNSITTNNWYHFTYVHDPSVGGKVYLNGALESSNSITGAICSSVSDLLIGAQNNTSSSSIWRYFHGSLDDIGIWNRALTPAEITNIYQSGQPCSVTHTTSLNICHRDSTLWNGKYYSSIGSDTVHLTSYQGCDSVDILNLNVYPLYYTVITQYFCKGHSMVFNGQTITTAGTYYYHYTSATGCDSTVRLRALYRAAIPITYATMPICVGGNVQYGGQTFTSPGVYKVTLQGYSACDSVVQLTLVKRTKTYAKVTIYRCPNDSILYYNIYYKANGVHTVIIPNRFGCDSVITLNVLTAPTSYNVLTQYICQGDSTLYHGVYYKQTGTYFIHLTNRFGCDSTVRLRLLYNNSSSLITVTLCHAQTITWNGKTYTWSMAGTYTSHFINYKGCDSSAVLKVYQGNCKLEGIAESTTITTTETFVESASPEMPINTTLAAAHNFEMNIYPNPNTGKFILENNCSTCKEMLVEIFTMDGKLLYSKTEDNSTGKINIDVQLVSGMYWVKMSNGNEGYSEMKKFVVNN